MKNINFLGLALLIGCVSFVACDKDDDEKGKGGNEPIGELKKISSIESHSSSPMLWDRDVTDTKTSFIWANGLLVNVTENRTYIIPQPDKTKKESTSIETNSFSYGDDGKLKKVVRVVDDYSWSIQIEYSGGKIWKIKEESNDTGEFGEKITHSYELTYDGDYISTITDEDGDIEYLTWKDGNLISREEKGEFGYVQNYSYDNMKSPFSYEQNPALAFVLYYFYGYTEGLGKNNAIITAYKDNDENYTKDNYTVAITYTYDNDNYPKSHYYTNFSYEDETKYVYE